MTDPKANPSAEPQLDDTATLGAVKAGEDSQAPAAGSSVMSGPMSTDEAEAAVRQAAKEGTNLDTLVGRLVVEQGLATGDEVQHALEQARSLRQEDNSKSVVQILVDNEYVTKRQIARLRQLIEAERSGQQIPGFKILGKLGSGAMATVYKAKQVSLDRLVAVKILPRKFSDNPQFIERFYAEGRAAAALNHPNIVQAFDVGKAGEFHYFVMEYVQGRTVHDDIIKQKRFSEMDAIDIIIQVATALDHAHDKGLIHRDVKPKNIMLSRDGTVKLADMGLARAMSDKEAAEAEAGKAFGTPYYIAPEQIRGERTVGPPADIYSLGATFYHMVCGVVPFEGKNPTAVMHKHLKGELTPPDQVNPKLSAGVSEVIETMMAKAPGKRYRSCKDLLGDLRAIRAGETPPIAHKDHFDAMGLQSIAESEQQAGGEIAIDSSGQARSGPGLGLMIGLVTSIVLNLVLIAVSVL